MTSHGEEYFKRKCWFIAHAEPLARLDVRNFCRWYGYKKLDLQLYVFKRFICESTTTDYQ